MVTRPGRATRGAASPSTTTSSARTSACNSSSTRNAATEVAARNVIVGEPRAAPALNTRVARQPPERDAPGDRPVAEQLRPARRDRLRQRLDSLAVGMPVVNDAGLVGKIINVSPDTSLVMLVTDPRYNVPVKVIAEVDPAPSTTVPATVPSGLAVDDVTTTTSTTTRRRRPRRRCPTTRRDDRRDRLDRAGHVRTDEQHRRRSRSAPRPPRRRSPRPRHRETGVLDGRGADRLPRVELHRRLAVVRRVDRGRRRATPPAAATSLAPPEHPDRPRRQRDPRLERRVARSSRSSSTPTSTGSIRDRDPLHTASRRRRRSSDRAPVSAQQLGRSASSPIGMMLLALQKTMFADMQPGSASSSS